MHVRILHNGDLRSGTPTPSPHWMVHVREDGAVWGEVLTPGLGRMLPEGFRIPHHERFFNIPPELRSHQLRAQPHHEEVIISLVRPGGHQECSFLMSQLQADSSLKAALEDLLERIHEITEPDGPANGSQPICPD